jgi:DNA-binding response OmpR family regulator
VVLVTHPDGSGVAQIDGVGTPLPPYLAALLSILMADEGVAPDRLVGWTSVVDIQAGLKKRTRQNRSKAAVKELVYRLRKLLDQHLEDPFLLQHKRRLGYRFAVRRGVGTKPEGDNL